jgi:hypothetical protein
LIAAFQRVSVRHQGGALVGIAGELVLTTSSATASLDAVDIAALGTLIHETFTD